MLAEDELDNSWLSDCSDIEQTSPEIFSDLLFADDGNYPRPIDLHDLEFRFIETDQFDLNQYGNDIDAEMIEFLGRDTSRH
ncbi:MAG: hypothetical protein V3V03_01215 [Hyphomonadaceae bacterium]